VTQIIAADNHIQEYVSSLYNDNALGYANARTMAILSQSIIRIVQLRESKGEFQTKGVICIDDVQSFTWKTDNFAVGARRKIGFN